MLQTHCHQNCRRGPFSSSCRPFLASSNVGYDSRFQIGEPHRFQAQMSVVEQRKIYLAVIGLMQIFQCPLDPIDGPTCLAQYFNGVQPQNLLEGPRHTDSFR